MNAFSKIVVGVDSSARADEAARQALAVARLSGAEIVLVHVGLVPDEIEGLPPSMAGTARAYRQILAGRLAEDRRRLSELRERVSGQGVQVSQAVIDGFADVTLAEAAQRLGADLIVVGTHGRTGLRRILLGSVAERTVRLADISVLVVRGEVVAGGYRRLVVGTDFSPYSAWALDRAIAIAAPGADVHVVNCWRVPGEIAGHGETVDAVVGELRRDLAAASDERGRELLRPLLDRAVSVRFESLERSPIDGLVDAAAIDDADLVVVGSHGYRGLRRFVLGSVAEAVVRHAPCSVLVARQSP